MRGGLSSLIRRTVRRCGMWRDILKGGLGLWGGGVEERDSAAIWGGEYGFETGEVVDRAAAHSVERWRGLKLGGMGSVLACPCGSRGGRTRASEYPCPCHPYRVIRATGIWQEG